jgi:hypothetical protein
MASSDQSEASKEETEVLEQTDEAKSDESENVQHVSRAPIPLPTTIAGISSFDIVTLGIIAIIAASFASTARLNVQPPTSLVPAAVLSATGCGLLVTALRKLRTAHRPGLLKAGLAGLILALLQFISAISYPGVLTMLSTDAGQQIGFLATWGLVGAFSVIFAMAGAILGHLAFAPLRTLPKQGTRATTRASLPSTSSGVPTPRNTTSAATENSAPLKEPTSNRLPARIETPLHSFINYLITVLLLGLAPTLVGVVFSGAFDYMLSFYQFTPGPYPTTRLLSALLAWQIPNPLNLPLSPNTIVLLLWRIPVFLNNPIAFDVQALEPLVFNGAALALLLLTMNRGEGGKLSWPVYLALQVVMGILLVLPADLWMLEGLQGLLQVPSLNTVLPIPSLVILDQRAFVLNLITGPLVCLAMGLFLRESKPQHMKTP